MNMIQRFRRLSTWNKLGALGALASILGILLFLLAGERKPTVVNHLSHSGSGTIVLNTNGSTSMVTHFESQEINSGSLLQPNGTAVAVREDWESRVSSDGCLVAIVDVSTTIGGMIQENEYYEALTSERVTRVQRRGYASSRRFGLPALDFKLVNNCPITVVFSAAILAVEDSRPDLRPELIVAGANLAMGQRVINVRNNGWGVAKDTVMTGRLFQGEDESDGQPFEIKIGDIDLRAEINAVEFLRKAASIGQLAVGERVVVRGTLAYSFEGTDSAVQGVSDGFQFSISNIPPSPGPIGSQLSPSYAYSVALESSGRNYLAASRVSHALAPGEYDRFVVTIAAPISSFHSFVVKLKYNQSEFLELGSFDLHFYLPRWAAADLGALQ